MRLTSRGFTMASLALALLASSVLAAPAKAPDKTYKDPKLGYSFSYDGSYSLVTNNPNAQFILSPSTPGWSINMQLQPVSKGEAKDVATAVQNALVHQIKGIKMMIHPYPYQPKDGWYTFDSSNTENGKVIRTQVYIDPAPEHKMAYIFSGSAAQKDFPLAKMAWEKVLQTFKN